MARGPGGLVSISIGLGAAALAFVAMSGCVAPKPPTAPPPGASTPPPPQNTGTPCDARAAVAGPRAFCESFDGINTTGPVPFAGARWQIHQNVTDYQRWATGDAVEAQHAADCGPPPATHVADTWDEYVFVCRNHLMTARAAPSYGATYLMPNAQADWSGGEAAVAWDVSTLSMSSRDWIDLWITPFDGLLSVPIDEQAPTAYQGFPRNAIHVRNSNNADSWQVALFRDFTIVASTTFTLPRSVTPSATVRSSFELRITRNGLRFGMPTLNQWTTLNVAVPFSKGVVQWAQHSYNPTKDNSGVPASWHWDNFFVYPTSPLTMTRVAPRRTIANNGEVRTLTFAAPANAGDRLAFGGVCRIEVNFGAGWQAAPKQPSSRGNSILESSASYLLPVPPGARSAQVRFSGDGWYTGFPCLVETPVLLTAG